MEESIEGVEEEREKERKNKRERGRKRFIHILCRGGSC
jgi:hypothetical protein